MQECVHDRAKEQDASYLMSTTIEENKSMLRIFASQNYAIQAQVYGWPSGNLVRRLRTSDKTLADSIFQAIDTDITNEGTKCSLQWNMCTSTEKLSHAIRMLRAQGDNESEKVTSEQLWLPSEYAVVCSSGTDAQDAVENGCVWIASEACKASESCLGQSSKTNLPPVSVTSRPRAILFKTNGYLGGELVGIMAPSARMARCAMHFALSEFPQTEKFYVDPCNSTFISEKEIGYTITTDGGTENPEWHSYLVLTKMVEISAL